MKAIRAISKYLDDLLVLGGCFCILYGLSLWSVIVTWLVAGAMLIVLGVLYGKYGDDYSKSS